MYMLMDYTIYVNIISKRFLVIEYIHVHILTDEFTEATVYRQQARPLPNPESFVSEAILRD